MSQPSLCLRSLIKALAIRWVLCLITLAPTVSAAEQGDPSADDALLLACHQSVPCRTHLDKATQFYKQDRYDAALAEYQAAYVLQPFPLILYNIARIHHKQSRLSDAVAYYQRYLDTGHPDRAERAKELLSQAQKPAAQEPSKADPPVQEPSKADPPAPTALLAPQRSADAPPPAVTPAAPQPTPRASTAPLYSRWWLWTLLGVTVLGVAAGVGIGVYLRGPDVSGLPARTLDFGN